MEKKKIRALFFDVDGTLLGENTKQISPSTIQAIREAYESGIAVFIATGRDMDSRREAAAVDPVMPYVTGCVSSNGQHCFLKNGKEISFHGLDPDDFSNIRKVCKEHRLPILYEYNGIAYNTLVNESVNEFAVYVDLPVTPTRQIQPQERIDKICICVDENDEKSLLAPVLKNTCMIRNRMIVDVIPTNIGKESGITEVCRVMGYSPEEIMTFGDGLNDLGMLRMAGIGVAMGNGFPETFEAADYVTLSSDNGGIAHALKHFGLIGS